MHLSLQRAQNLLPKQTKTTQLGHIGHYLENPSIDEWKDVVKAMTDIDQPLESFGWSRSITVSNQVTIKRSVVKETRYYIEIKFPHDWVLCLFFERPEWALIKEVLRPALIETQDPKKLYQNLQIAKYGKTFFEFTLTTRR